MFKSLKEKFKKQKEKFKNQREKSKEKKLEKVRKEIDKVTEEKERLKQEKKELKELKKEKKKEPEEILEKEKELPLTSEEPESEPEKKGMMSQIKELNEKIDIISDKKKAVKKLKKKKFKIPFKVKSQLKKLAVKNKVQVMLLQRTKNIKPVIGEIREGMLLIKDGVYNGAVNATWLWNGKYPTHIVPEWDLQPLTLEGIKKMKETTTLSPDNLYADTIKKVIVIIICAVLFGGGLV